MTVTAAAVAVIAGLGNVVIRMVVVGLMAAAAAVVAAVVALYLTKRASRDQSRIDELENRLSSLEGTESSGAVGSDAGPSSTANAPDADAPAVLEPPVAERPDAEPPAAEPTTIDARPRAAKDADVLTDDATGLFSESYFRVALDARLSAARRHLRPVAVVIIDVIQDIDAPHPLPVDPALVAEGIRETVRDADTACRMSDGRFGLVLEDTPENGAIWTVERVRRHLSAAQPEDAGTLWAGVACYPAHAFDTDEMLRQAEEALTSAREWRQDRIEVATAP